MTPPIRSAHEMSRFYFHIRNGRPFDDVDGLELADVGAARAEAVALARDIMRLEPLQQDWSKWAIHVTDEHDDLVLDIPFLTAI